MKRIIPLSSHRSDLHFLGLRPISRNRHPPSHPRHHLGRSSQPQQKAGLRELPWQRHRRLSERTERLQSHLREDGRQKNKASPTIFNETDVLVWWGHVRNKM